MKRFASLLLVLLFALNLTSCQIGRKNGKKDSAEHNVSSAVSASKEEHKLSTTVDYSYVLKELNRKERKFVDSLGVTEKGKKIVAFFGDDFETQVIVAEFKDGKVNSAKDYRFYEKESNFEAYKFIAENNKNGFTVHEEEKCIEQNEIKRYRGKTYDEMLELLHGYDFKY